METGQLSMDVINAARRVVDSAHQRPASNLDFSPESLPIVEGMLAEAATFAAGLSASTKEQLGQSFGCYILEVGRRQFGGRYFWHDQYDAPSWLSENRRFTLPWCPATRCAQAQRRPRGQHPVLLRWLCQTGKGGAPGGRAIFI